MARLERYPLTLLGLALITACDANQIGPAGVLGTERGAIAAAVPSVLGSYAGTAAAHVRTSKGLTAAVSCPISVDISTQTDDRFSGTVAIQASDKCKAESGTLSGTVDAGGLVAVTADAPGDGPNVFDDAAARTGCTLVRSSGTFNGRIVDNALTVEGNAVYDCPFFGGIRAFADVTVSASRT